MYFSPPDFNISVTAARLAAKKLEKLSCRIESVKSVCCNLVEIVQGIRVLHITLLSDSKLLNSSWEGFPNFLVYLPDFFLDFFLKLF